ncbi:MAG: hypothetical protein ACI4CY_07750 [Candidatus Gastranaerophilaceae bacterium]
MEPIKIDFFKKNKKEPVVGLCGLGLKKTVTKKQPSFPPFFNISSKN